jgi:demethylmenaquinone methyltransferase/2-methoxy-6-polyprenyl-1,4-benzoquinol methylase
MTRTSHDPAAVRAFYTRISSIYDRLADRNERRARAIGLALLNARSGERILEIGFGTGSSIIPLATSVGERGSVAGIDISPGMKAVADERVRSARLAAPTNLRVAAVPPIPFPAATFDAVFMAFTLELFPDDTIPIVLRGVHRTLKGGGRLAVVSMTLGTEEQRQGLPERLYMWCHQHFPHIVDCRPIDAERCLAEAEFTIARVERLAIWGLPVATILAHRPSTHLSPDLRMPHRKRILSFSER